MSATPKILIEYFKELIEKLRNQQDNESVTADFILRAFIFSAENDLRLSEIIADLEKRIEELESK